VNDEIFAARFYELTQQHKSVARGLCALLDVPYHEDRETERLLGHRRMRQQTLEDRSRIYGAPDNDDRLEGPLLPTRLFRMPDGQELAQDEFPPLDSGAEQLTEEVWTRDHYPDSYNGILEAVTKLPHGVTGGYYHRGQMMLVLISPTGERVGIRRAEFMLPTRSMLAERVAPLAKLRKAATA